MPQSPSNSGIRDNHKRGVVADFLKAKIQSGSRLSVVSAYFTIYAYAALKDRLDQIEHLDFLFGEPRFIAPLDPDKTEKKAFILDGNGLQLANKLQQKRVARECADWIRQKVDMTLYNKLLAAAVDSIARTFQRRVAAGLQTGRDFVSPNEAEQARETTDFELITWLVIKAP